MNTALKLAWTNALVSGKYKQTRMGYLKGKRGYCCLGVLCDVAGKEIKPGVGYMSRDIRRSVGISEDIQKKLAGMNDRGHWNFKRIAGWIKENL